MRRATTSRKKHVNDAPPARRRVTGILPVLGGCARAGSPCHFSCRKGVNAAPPARRRATPSRRKCVSAASPARRGRFLVVDGPDGAGKSTQVRLLAEELQCRGLKTLCLREPGGTPAGEAIRAILLARRHDGLGPLTEAFLFEAARAQLVHEVIAPALARGTWVLCDRFTLSTLVYQGYAGGVDPRAIRRMSDLATVGVKPDLYVVLWVPPRVGLQRRAQRQPDRMEAKGLRFLRAVTSAYRRAAGGAPGAPARGEEANPAGGGARRSPARDSGGRIRLVNGCGPVERVCARIWKYVEPLLP